MVIKILPRAKQRIIEIWDYTSRIWDEEQADTYTKGLTSHILDISSHKMSWSILKEKRMKNIFYLQYRHHYIFFRELSDHIGVISILHENMDIPARLKEDNR